MSLSNRFKQLDSKLDKALDSYCDDLMDKQRDNLHEWIGTEQKSVKRRNLGKLHEEVGLDIGTLMSNQLNATKVNYAQYDFGGHKEVLVPFTRPVPNSKKGTDYWWHRFPSSNGYAPILDALHQMPKFKTYL